MTEVEVTVEADVWVDVSIWCAGCNEKIEIKKIKAGRGIIEVDVEAHKCEG